MIRRNKAVPSDFDPGPMEVRNAERITALISRLRGGIALAICSGVLAGFFLACLALAPRSAGAGAITCVDPSLTVNPGTCLPDHTAKTFLPGTPIDNPYFPILGNTTRIFESTTAGIDEGFQLTPFGPGPELLGVQTTTLLDRAFEDGLLVEETFDYYAQDTHGNVWYFGEDVTNFEYDMDNNLIGTNSSSSWLAGVNDALPGIIMFADPTDVSLLGFNHFQEHAEADDAVDEAEIVSIGETLILDIGTFTDVVKILETISTEPDVGGFKYYAPGIGLTLEEEGVGPLGLDDPELTVELVATVPEPATLALFGGGLVGLGFIRRRQRTIA